MADKPFIGTKLVRDWVPSLEHPSSVYFRTASPEEMPQLLYAKMTEEMQEVMMAARVTATVSLDDESIDRNEHVAEELADCLAVLQALADALGVPWEGVWAMHIRKVNNRGTFSKRYVMEVRP